MDRKRMIMALAVLFIIGLLLISFGSWLFTITNDTGWGFYSDWVKPYGTLGFVMVIFGTLLLVVAIGLLFDWYHLLIHT